jgi:CHAT domain-containing protein
VAIQTASLRAIQGILHSDEEILEFVLDEPVSFCITVTNQKAEILTLPSGKARIEALAEDYTSRLRTRKPFSALGTYLYSTLLPKSLPKRVIVVPDGKLNFLPFESLMDSAGSFVLQSHVVSYASSSTLLRSLRTKRAHRKPRRPLLAMGGVPYEANTEAPTENLRGLERLFGNQLRDLPNTGQEVSAISELFPGKTTILLNTQATETAFKQQPLDDFRILHLAVHAVADDQFPDRAALILAHNKDSKDDGLLQAREITRLHLNADLVTLSACETAFGKLEGREGVSSLKEAFLRAGARSVVASLWNVEDQSTTRLMVAFYKHVAKGEDKAEALRNAKLDFMRDNPGTAPFYWAGFIITGEGSSSISATPN